MEQGPKLEQSLNYETPTPRRPPFAVHWGGWIVLIVLSSWMVISAVRRF